MPFKLSPPFQEMSTQNLGGLFTEADARSIPQGAASLAQDNDFLIAGIGPRPGRVSAMNFTGGTPETIQYLESMDMARGRNYTLAQDTGGSMWYEDLAAEGSMSPFLAGLMAGSRALAFNANDRAYLCLSNLLQGTDQPRQWDGSISADTGISTGPLWQQNEVDRISQVGPGVAPTVTPIDGPLPPTMPVLSSTAGGNLPARTAWVVMAYTLASGTTVASVEASIALAANTLLVVQTPGAQAGATGWNVYVSESQSGQEVLQASSLAIGTNWTEPVSGLVAGIAAPVSDVAAGQRYGMSMFLTRTGFLTPGSPPVAFTTTKNTASLALGNLAVGPANVISRVFAFTESNASIGGPYYYVPIATLDPNLNMASATVVDDNSSATASFNISDTVLLASINVMTEGNNVFQMRELGEPVKGLQYAGRAFFMGCRNKVDQFLNPTFDGGSTTTDPIAGWTPAGTLASEFSLETSPIFGQSLYFKNTAGRYINQSGNGDASISQSAYQTALQTPILQQSTQYGIRVTLWSPGGNSTGTIVVSLSSALQGSSYSFTVSCGELSKTPREFEGAFGNPAWKTVPSDLQLEIYPENFPANADFAIDRIETYDVKQPVLSSQVAVSYAENPEAFDAITGVLDISNFTNDPITNLFRFLNTVYITTRSRYFSTQDNGTTEPSGWTINEVTNMVGCFGPLSMALGEEYVLTADRRGLFLFDGGSHIKIMQEIQQVWEQIEWTASNQVWIVNDRQQQRILVGVPIATPISLWTTGLPTLAAPSTPNLVLMCSYLTMAPGATISQNPGVIVSAFTGKLLQRDGNRKWSIWTIAAPFANWIQRQDTNERIWFGGNGGVSQLDSSAFADLGAPILEAYRTYDFSDLESEQMMQLGSVRKLYPYASILLEGVGSFLLSLFPETPRTPYAVNYPALPLASPALDDTNVPMNTSGNRMFVQIATDGNAGSYFLLRRIVLGCIRHPRVQVSGR